MNRALPLVSLCVAILSLSVALMPRDPVMPPPSPEAPRAEPDGELRRRIELLEDDHRALWDRVALLERRQLAAPAVDGGPASPSLVAEVASLREELRGAMTGEVLSSEAGRTALKAVIREAEAEWVRERLAQRYLERQERAGEQKARWKDFVTTARLSPAQEQELTKRLEAEEAARLALQEQQQNGGPAAPDAFRALWDQRRETDQVMGGLLDATQKEQYQAVRREDRGGPGGGRPSGERVPR